MSDYWQKTRELLSRQTFALSQVPPLDPLETLSLLDGQTLTIGKGQVPLRPVSANYSTWRYNATGQYNNALVNGGLQQIKIDRGSGTGRNISVPYARMHLYNNTGSPCTIVPGPLLWQNVLCLTPDGAPIQNHDGAGIWNCITEVSISYLLQKEATLAQRSIN